MIITFVRAIALYGGLFLLPFLLQGLLHYSEIQSGLLILPNSIMMAIFTPLAGSWSDKYGPKKIVITGLGLVALSMLLFSQADQPLTWYILIAMSIRGLGMGFLVSPITSTSLNAVLPNETTGASSMYTLIQQLGGSIGIALSGVMHQFLFTFYSSKGYSQGLAEHHAIEDVFIISMFLVLVAILPALGLPFGAQPQKNNAFNAAAVH
jgi:DHA2 family multidrug resistance protein